MAVVSLKNYFIALLCISTCSLAFLVLLHKRNARRIQTVNGLSYLSQDESQTSIPPEDSIIHVFETRRALLDRGCKKHFGFWPRGRKVLPSFVAKASYDLLFVNDQYRVLFCGIPKVASTNWRKVFFVASMPSIKMSDLDDDDSDIHKTHPAFRPLREYTEKQVNDIVQNYTKIVFVRNPLERVLSAWASKFTKQNPVYPKLFGSDIIREFRRNPTREEIEEGQPVYLQEFFQFLLKRGSSDTHWAPQHNLCSVCLIPYDFIGKFETLREDADFIIENVLKMGGKLSFPAPGNTSSSLSRQDYKKHLKAVPLEWVKKVVESNSIDFELFGYDKNVTSFLLL